MMSGREGRLYINVAGLIYIYIYLAQSSMESGIGSHMPDPMPQPRIRSDDGIFGATPRFSEHWDSGVFRPNFLLEYLRSSRLSLFRLSQVRLSWSLIHGCSIISPVDSQGLEIGSFVTCHFAFWARIDSSTRSADS